MAKKLLSEAVVRRFAKLANLPTVNEMKYNRDDESEEAVEETITPNGRTPITEEEEEMDLDAAEEEMPMPDEEPMEEPLEEPMEDPEAEGQLDLTDEEAQVIIDLGQKLAAAMPEGGAEDLGAVEDAPMDDLDAEVPMDAAADEEEEVEDIMGEALKGITYVPEKKEIVEEVARRVAKRLLKAKKANAQLSEALGTTRTKKAPSRRRRSKK